MRRNKWLYKRQVRFTSPEDCGEGENGWVGGGKDGGRNGWGKGEKHGRWQEAGRAGHANGRDVNWS